MKKYLAVFLTLIMFLPATFIPVVAQTQLSDISGHWAENTILALVEKGYISGYPDGTFKPDNTITRAEFIKIMTSVVGIAPITTGESKFSDVASADWFFGYVQAAVEKGLIGGYPDGTFQPNNPITRQEAAKIVVKAGGKDETTVDVEAVFANAGNFTDKDQIADWAKPFVAAAVQYGYMKGDASNAFRPSDNITRAETAAIAYRLLPKAAIKVGQVTDTGGIDDKSFNATAWKGVQDAMEQLGVEGKYLESQQQTDYEKNINAFLEEKCDLIITVGFLLADATKAAAEANPDQKFAIVDYAYDPALPNVLGLVFNTDEAAALAGYLAAGVTKTGKVGTFGGMQIPTVTIFMDGFYYGVQYYNQKHNTNVQVLGWDPATQKGLFAGNFESLDDGRRLAESLMAEGADIIMPVAGPVGLGAAAAAKEAGNTYIIGVDTDWYVSANEYADVTLTSVVKEMDLAVFNAIKQVVDGTFKGGIYVGTLENSGVDIAPFHNLESMVPDELKQELEQVRQDVISGIVPASPARF